MRELQERRRWGAPAVWAFALSVAALALWVLAPEDVWRRTRSEEADLQNTPPGAPTPAEPATTAHQDRTPHSFATTSSPANVGVIVIGADTADLKRSHSKTLSGYVRFDDGIPVFGAAVWCTLIGAGPDAKKTFGGVLTKQDGTFRVLVHEGETYTVQARFGDAWTSVELRAKAGRQDLEFVVPSHRRLTFHLLNKVSRPPRIEDASAVWLKGGVQARSRTEEPGDTLILPAVEDVEPGTDILVRVRTGFRSSGRERLFRLRREQLERGPLSFDLRLEPPLPGSWSLRLRMADHDGAPYEGLAFLEFKPTTRSAPRQWVVQGTATFEGLDRNFDDIRVYTRTWMSKSLDLSRPDAGQSVEVSLEMPEPWQVTVAPRFERRTETVVMHLRVWSAEYPPRGAFITRPWNATGMGAGRWWASITAYEDGKPALTLWQEALTLAGGDDVTLNPWIPAGKPAEEKD